MKIKEAAKHYAYMLRCADGTIYSGYTTDPDRRAAIEHIRGGGRDRHGQQAGGDSPEGPPERRGRDRRRAQGGGGGRGGGDAQRGSGGRAREHERGQRLQLEALLAFRERELDRP